MVERDAAAQHAGRLRLLLVLLLAADGVFGALSIVHHATPYLPDRRFSVEHDRGFAESFQYAKEFAVVILLAMLWRRTRWLSTATWALVMLYLLVDDAVSIHEIGGDIAYRHLGLSDALGLRAQDFGELVINGLVGIGVLGILGLGYKRGGAEERSVSRDLALLVAILAGFGVGVDLVHSMVTTYGPRIAVGLIEDGGEMVTMSVIVWYTMTVRQRDGAPPTPSLWERVAGAAARARHQA